MTQNGTIQKQQLKNKRSIMVKLMAIIFLLYFPVMASGQSKEKLGVDSVGLELYKINGVLKDFNLGGTCGTFSSAGIFLFELKQVRHLELKSNKVFIIIQCARSGFPVDFFKKGKKYKMIISKNKLEEWVDVKNEKFDKMKYPKFFLHSFE